MTGSIGFLLLLAVVIVSTEARKYGNTCPPQNHKGEELYHLVHADCRKFYKCDHGKMFEYQCSDGLFFNPDLSVCDYPERVNCKPVKVKCPKDNREAGRLVHLPHEYCNKFYKCDHGQPIEFQCPKNEYFLVDLEVCGPLRKPNQNRNCKL